MLQYYLKLFNPHMIFRIKLTGEKINLNIQKEAWFYRIFERLQYLELLKYQVKRIDNW